MAGVERCTDRPPIGLEPIAAEVVDSVDPLAPRIDAAVVDDGDVLRGIVVGARQVGESRGIGDQVGLRLFAWIAHDQIAVGGVAEREGGQGDRRDYSVAVVDREIADLQLRAWQRARSEEHTSELQSLMRLSYAVFCL